ncbi:MAG TPA: pentapeptide repeat-containing protein [Methanothrix sp.]
MSLRILVILALLVAMVEGESPATFPQDVPADEILSRMSDGQSIYYDGINITGDLNLSSLLGSRTHSRLQLINCTVSSVTFKGLTMDSDLVLWGTSFGNASFDKASFLGMADLANTSFQHSSFLGTAFSGPAVFDGARFQGDVSFEDAKFHQDASFNDVVFEGVADFNYSSFDSYTYFSGAHFLQEALFSDVDFSGALDFSASSFAGKANFFQSRFNTAGFSNAIFSGPVQFGLAKFSGLSSFGDAVFAGEAGFNLARFSDAAYFSGAVFQKDAFFGLTKFQDIASFQDAKFEGDLNFKGGSISTLLFEKATLATHSRINLNDTDFARFRAHWKDIGDHVVWDPGAYLALVSNYHSLGWSDDEDDCYYQYRNLDQSHQGWGVSRAVDVMAWLSCGYGVRPGYAVAWALLTILAFAQVFWKGDGIRRSAKPLYEPAEQDGVPEHVTFRNALFFSTMIFLSQGPIDFLPVGRHRYYVILEGIFGWLLLALFLVTLGRVMIR